MNIEKLVLYCLLSVCNIFRFVIPVKKNRITFISLTTDHLEQDFKKINDQLIEKENYDIKYNLVVFKKTIWGKFLYLFNCICQLYQIHRSHIVILNDNNYVVTKFKRPTTKVIQVWHASGAIKKFGNQIPRKYLVQNYDYVVCNADYWKSIFSEAFGVKRNQVVVMGIPRVDDLCNEQKIDTYRKRFYTKFPEWKDKYVFLYAPTFRGNIIDGLKKPDIDLASVLNKMDKEAVFLYKAHPLLGSIDILDNENFRNVSKENLYMLMCSCDCLITDYSSIVFDYSLLGKKMICYAPDITDYNSTIGFNIDYCNEMPGSICENEDELIMEMKSKDSQMNKLPLFREKYMEFQDGRNTERVFILIKKIIENN